jgi:Gryzun, putative trafficking through Golgi
MSYWKKLFFLDWNVQEVWMMSPVFSDIPWNCFLMVWPLLFLMLTIKNFDYKKTILLNRLLYCLLLFRTPHLKRRRQKSQLARQNSFLLVSFSYLQQINSTVQPLFTFQSKSSSAGSPVSFQLSLQLHARRNLPGVTFSSASLSFNEQIPEIVLTHSSSESKKLQKLQPNEPAGSANLSLEPGETKVMEFTYTPVAEALIEVFKVRC